MSRFRTDELVRLDFRTYGRVMGPRQAEGWPVELMSGHALYVPGNRMTSAEGRTTTYGEQR